VGAGVAGAADVQLEKRTSERHPIKNLFTDNLVIVFPS
jgi:hypothetical protein